MNKEKNQQKKVYTMRTFTKVLISSILIVGCLALGFYWGYYLAAKDMETIISQEVQTQLQKQREALEDSQTNQEATDEKAVDEESESDEELVLQEKELRKYVNSFMEERLEKDIQGSGKYVMSELWNEIKDDTQLTGMSNPHYESYEIVLVENTSIDPYEFEVKVKIDEYAGSDPVSYFTETQTWVDSGGLTQYKLDSWQASERTNY